MTLLLLHVGAQVPAAGGAPALLLEVGDNLLLEDGSNILLE